MPPCVTMEVYKSYPIANASGLYPLTHVRGVSTSNKMRLVVVLGLTLETLTAGQASQLSIPKRRQILEGALTLCLSTTMWLPRQVSHQETEPRCLGGAVVLLRYLGT